MSAKEDEKLEVEHDLVNVTTERSQVRVVYKRMSSVSHLAVDLLPS